MVEKTGRYSEGDTALQKDGLVTATAASTADAQAATTTADQNDQQKQGVIGIVSKAVATTTGVAAVTEDRE